MLAYRQLSFWQSAAFYGILLVHFSVSATASDGNLIRHVSTLCSFTVGSAAAVCEHLGKHLLFYIGVLFVAWGHTLCVYATL
jgi:hypothetical protein